MTAVADRRRHVGDMLSSETGLPYADVRAAADAAGLALVPTVSPHSAALLSVALALLSYSQLAIETVRTSVQHIYAR